MERHQKKKVKRVKRREPLIFQVRQRAVSHEEGNLEKNMQSGKWMSTMGKMDGKERENKQVSIVN